MGNYLIVDTANGMFDVAASEVVQLHSVKGGSINLTNNTVYAATQVGTARVRSMDWDTVSGNTGNADTNHSNYRLYLWDVNTSNNITGTVAGAQSNTQIIQLETATTSYVNDAYTGASITVNTTNGLVDITSDVRIINDYYSNSIGHFVVANTELSQASIATTTYEIDFKIKDVESAVVSALSQAPATECTISTSADVSDPGKYNNSSAGNTILGSTDKNTLVFPLPQSPIKETTIAGNTVSYIFKKVSQSLSSDSDGKLSITLPDFQFMPGGTGTAMSRNDARENFIVIVKDN